MYKLLVILLVLFPSVTSAWITVDDFDTGTVGQTADKNHPDGSSGFDTAYGATFSNTWAMGGSEQSAAVTFNPGMTEMAGGKVKAGTTIVAGQFADIKADMYFPSGWRWGGSYLYLLRIPVLSSGDTSEQGYISYCADANGNIVIENTLGRSTTYDYTGVSLSQVIGRGGVNIELQVFLSAELPVIKAWIGKTLIYNARSASRPTVKDPSNIVKYAYVANQWTGNIPATQTLYVDNVTFTERIQSCLDNYNTHFIGQTPCANVDTTPPKPPTGLTSVSFKSDILYYIGTRYYQVHLPSGYSPSATYPLFIYLHGGGGNVQSGYNDGIAAAADKMGFIAAFPAGTPAYDENSYQSSWNGGAWDYRTTNSSGLIFPGVYSYETDAGGPGCCGTADDVTFLNQMIANIKSEFNVDTRRISIGGISNGGLMALRMICENPGVFSGVVEVAASGMENVNGTYSDNCSGKLPTNAMLIHGTSDPCNRFDGSQSAGSNCSYNSSTGVVTCTGPYIFCNAAQYRRPNYADYLSIFLLLNGGNLNSHSTYYFNNTANCQSYPGAKETVLCVMTGMGHAWPSGAQYFSSNIIGRVDYDLSNTQIFQKVLSWTK